MEDLESFDKRDILSLAIEQLIKDKYIACNENNEVVFLPKGKAWVNKRRRTKNSKSTYMDTAIRYLVRKKYIIRIPGEEGQTVSLTDKGKIAACDIVLKGKENG